MDAKNKFTWATCMLSSRIMADIADWKMEIEEVFQGIVITAVHSQQTYIVMGIVFGVTGSKEPAFNLIQSVPFEVREYQPYFVAEVSMRPGFENEAFPILAKYIGVFGNPQNSKQMAMAMTAPVITEPLRSSEAIAMTAPVLTSEKQNSMGFVLPSEYTRREDVPDPTDSRVSIKAIPGQTVAVSKFSGWYSAKVADQYRTKLCNLLHKDNVISETDTPDSLQ
eukprot:gene37591-49216_t